MPDQAYMQELFITGLKNAHGVEHQALQLMDRQIEHLRNYPEVADMLRMHRVETEQQIARIDELLAGFGTEASALKDAVLSFTGNMAALAHMPAPDEILKNSFANHAFENFEIAAYTSLLTMADLGSFGHATVALQQSLGEEQRMAQLVLDSIPAVTRKYAELRSAGETAGH
ncbi:ferritin-like domain-containing protein [Sphingomonas sp.]|jgi:ferritin-like metal-binding protein YciE|uniref:ferritin-like domain-containing protein n=1 Tax=Sphingomonas sp. TaxID=28214 RepID=UPI002D7E5241|nr:ferritin-like domain-containing protein [Sphingomonas sp.]HEU0044658.1 ferritin-like domain-containing protein [Sphingomonas sp.]